MGGSERRGHAGARRREPRFRSRIPGAGPFKNEIISIPGSRVLLSISSPVFVFRRCLFRPEWFFCGGDFS